METAATAAAAAAAEEAAATAAAAAGDAGARGIAIEADKVATTASREWNRLNGWLDSPEERAAAGWWQH